MHPHLDRPDQEPGALARAVLGIGFGEHLGLIYRERADSLRVTAAHFAQALGRDERCLFVLGDGERQELLAALHEAGVDTRCERERGALVLVEADEFCPQDEGFPFDVQRMAERMRRLSAGGHFAGVRWAIEMQALCAREASRAALLAWEAHLSALVHELEPASVLCLYDRARHAPDFLMALIGRHPALFVGQHLCRNPYHEPAQVRQADDVARARLDWRLEQIERLRDDDVGRCTRDDVLRVVAHDLKNPLAAISLGSELLLRRLPDEGPDIERRQLTAIRTAVRQADHLIHDLLDVARMEAGKLPLETSRQPLPPIIDEALALHRPLAEQAHVLLDTDLDEDLPELRVDRRRILQLIGNLLGNAIKFSPEGSRVLLAATLDDHHVTLRVTDQGPGIAPEDQVHLFEPFWQARGGRGGAGLGLAIARGITEAHGGTIDVESEPGQGATFCVRLPLGRP